MTLRHLFYFLICFTLSYSSLLSASEPLSYALVLHGGAGNITSERLGEEISKEYEASLNKALEKGLSVLKSGGEAIEAVEAVIVAMENDPLFNAGKGAVFTHEGRNELDASIMLGDTLDAGAVAGVVDIKNPILAARAVMEHSPHVMLSGKGASVFAVSQGIETVDADYFFTQKNYDRLQRQLSEDKHGTVGCVALDQYGNLCAGTSTGGMSNKRWGRIGDSPVIGAGTYANNKTCGISATGHGEYFIRYAVAHDISALMEYRGVSILDASVEVVKRKLVKAGGGGGIVGLDAQGNPAMVFNTAGMFRAYGNSKGERFVALFAEATEGLGGSVGLNNIETDTVEKACNNLLDRFHQKASEADFDGYFSCFTHDGVFFGTDASERWNVEEFKAYAKPHFDKGKGWTFVPTERNLEYRENEDIVVFDELLSSIAYGCCRGTGVLRYSELNSSWQVQQYHLTIPIPNESAKDVVELIAAREGQTQN